MGLIPQNIIDQIIQETDIIDLIQEYIPLKKLGANYKSCCPFHQEKTPSFVVSPQKQIYHCFGCGVGGNVIGFLMNYEKLEFPDAIQKLAERASIEFKKDRSKPKDELEDKYFKVNAYAHWFFQQAFQKSKKANTYCQKRWLSEQTIQDYQLGYAPDSFEQLSTYLKQKKIPTSLAESLGLIKPGKRAGTYDFFRDRLIFPILNLRGKIVGFGGRTLSGKNEAKYINSAESPIYNKSNELYGFFQAKKEISRLSQVIIVEGYIDTLACAQLGLKNVVAPLGTSLTLNQVKAIKKYAKDIVMMFDGDDAGKKAAVKGVETCLQAQIHPRIILLPDNTDPGDFLQATEMTGTLKEMLNKAQLALDWLFAEYYKKITSNPQNRARLIRGMAHWINQLADPVEKMEYQKKMTQFFEIPPAEIQKIVEITNDSDTLQHSDPDAISLEARLIALFIQHPGDFSQFRLEDISQHFENQHLKRLASFLDKFTKKHETFDVAHAIHSMDPELHGILTRILLKGYEINIGSNTSKHIKECIQKFYQQKNKKRLKEITAEIVQADLTRNTKLKLTLLKEKQKLLNTTT